MRNCISFFLILAFCALPNIAQADMPELINYQGRLTDGSGNPVPDGPQLLTFTIYDGEYGAELWSETQMLHTHSGLFNVLLGSVTPIQAGIFMQPERWLGTRRNGAEVTPRQRLTTVPYSFRAQSADYVGLDTSRIAETITLLQDACYEIDLAYTVCDTLSDPGCLANWINTSAEQFLTDFDAWLRTEIQASDTMRTNFLLPILDIITAMGHQDLEDRQYDIWSAWGNPDALRKLDDDVLRHDLHDLALTTQIATSKAELLFSWNPIEKIKQWLKDLLKDLLDKIVEDIPALGDAFKKIFDALKKALE